MSRKLTVTWMWVLGMVLWGTGIVEPVPEKVIRAVRIEGGITLDGVLDETAWQQAEGTDDFVQQSPVEGGKPSEHTVVRVLYDDEKLYISFQCDDARPNEIVANEMRRDGELWQNDNVYVLLDTYGDKRRGFFFRTNALGAQADSSVTDGGQNINGSWDCIWECVGRRSDTGWVVEIGIPFNQLRFKEAEEMEWGINFGRNIMRTDESNQWYPVPRSESWPGTYHPTYTGRLIGLRGIHPPAHLSFKPYLLGGRSESWDEEDIRWDQVADRNGGIDFKYGVTPNLTLDLTFNTDFAQVEADREQVNLNRFDLYFPEKREFFLEGSGLFAFGAGNGGWGPPPLSLFYSRRIGIEEEEQIRILGGGKLTGKVGKHSIGVLNMFTEHTPDVPRTSFSVLRVQRDILERSSVGFIVTNRQSELGGSYARNGGIDLSLRPKDQWKLKAMMAGSWSPRSDERDFAWYLSSDWRNDRLSLDVSYLDIGPDFMAEIGFVRRTDIRSFNLGTGLDWRFEESVLRGAGTNLRMGYSTDHENRKLGWNVGLGSGMHFDSGDGFELELNRSFDRVDEAFEINDSEIPAGDYEIDEISLGLGSSEIRPLSIGMRGSYGDFFDGTRVSYEMGSRWRVTYQLAIEVNYDRNQIRLADTKFSTNVFGTRISYSLNTRFFTKLFAQWNDTSDRFGANFLLHWIYRPGSDFYLVYDQRWNTEDGFNTEAWTVLGKTTYLLSF